MNTFTVSIAYVGLANFPDAYRGLKIITSLSLRFPDFQRGKLKTARFFMQHVLPQASSLCTIITSGSEELMSMDVDEF